MLIGIAGWCGAVLLAFCGLPQAIKTWRSGSFKDGSWLFLAMWGVGEVLTLVYVLGQNMSSGQMQWPLLLNYTMNMAIVAYLAWAKWR
jgi:uncharacterized protein with PQ loop repeat